MTDTPKTLLDACRYYADPKVCFETMLRVKWPDGKIVCPKCGGDKVGAGRHEAISRRCKMRSWDYTDTYIASCLRPFSTRAEGVEHERHCEHCQRILRGEPEPEEEDEDDDETTDD
ncbi:MAG: hypothetical protein ACREA9_17460 [Pyrinomonadaceae bacterium]